MVEGINVDIISDITTKYQKAPISLHPAHV